MSRTLLLGANSVLGWGLFQHLRQIGKTTLGTCSPSTRQHPTRPLRPLDLLDSQQILNCLQDYRPNYVFHCAAICKVDKCEREPRFAWDVNVIGTQHLLDAIKAIEHPIRLIYCSSDHVFGGGPNSYNEESPPTPCSHYGRTRVEAEQRVLFQDPSSLVIRVPLCIGPSYNGRSGHLDWLRYRYAKGLPITIVRDEHRSALPLDRAAQRVYALALSSHTGLRHLQATAPASRPELAHHLCRALDLDVKLRYQWRRERPGPHLGRVELTTLYQDIYAHPIPSALTAASIREKSPAHPGLF